jgi:hypothetical protein
MSAVITQVVRDLIMPVPDSENIALVVILNRIPVPGRPRSSWPAWRRAKSSRPVYQRGVTCRVSRDPHRQVARETFVLRRHERVIARIKGDMTCTA